MKISYRQATEKDIKALTELHINQLLEEGEKPIYDLRPYLIEYYEKHILDESFISWVALDGDVIIATSGLSLTEKPPYFANQYGRYGILSSIYTVKKYRRNGIAKNLLQKIIKTAERKNCGQIWLTASDMGIPLYESFGFKKNANFMSYQIK